MSCGPLPPVPDLIPISAFHKNQSFNNNRLRECAPCETHSEVMGEQRSRRTGKQPAIDLIDTSRSRGLSAAPQAPFRKTRPERHRKSDRRREHRSGRKRSSSKQRSRSRVSSPERPVNPRVNPIFVWVRQEDTHIVEVKCEDYDKRNRILLTKTAQGWRAIPRTETLVPSLKDADDKSKHRVRKQRKTHKVKRKSTGIQVDECISENEITDRPISPTWSDPVNVESHLPSHTIHVPKKRSPSPEEFAQPDENVNSATNSSVQKPVIERNINKSCDVTPLDNLLAVAELEFNHQLQSGEWNKCTETDNELDTITDLNDTKEKADEYIDNIEQLNNFIDSCTNNNINDTEHIIESFNDVQSKTDDCDYNDDDDNTLAMDDILNRLEQSLRSPDAIHGEMAEVLNDCDNNLNSESLDDKEDDVFMYESKESKCADTDSYVNKADDEKNEDELKSSVTASDTIIQSTSEDVVDSPTDLTTKFSYGVSTESLDDIQPTDLSLPKRKESKSPPPRPPSQNSETIQSPQPSGIPAVPPSPDIFSNLSNGKSKSIFLETLLSNSCQKVADTSEVTDDKEPLDLGNFRKSASPTVTCSEEVKSKSSDDEPKTKKLKVEDITLKKLLDEEPTKNTVTFDNKIFSNDQGLKETSRLLELLTSPIEPDPVAQLNQVLSDSSLNMPDPMLVPKDRLSQILSSPAREIPRLLIDRPELRLPQALAFPHLLQDPDILVITLSQLQTIVYKQSQLLPVKDLKENDEKRCNVQEEKRVAKSVSENVKCVNPKQQEHKEERHVSKESQRKAGHINELANDIDAATNAAFNQMMWLPYLNQLEPNTFSNNSDFLKFLTMIPPYSTHMPEMSHLMGMNRFVQPAGFPVQSPFNCNPLEFSTWQEAMLQANLLRPKTQYDMYNSKNFYREYPEKNSVINTNKKPNHFHSKPTHKSNSLANMYSANMATYQNSHNPLLNMTSTFQPTSTRANIQIPQYNPVLSHRSINNVQNINNIHKNKITHHNKNLGSRMDNVHHHQRTEEKKLHQMTQISRTDQQSITTKTNANNKSISNFTHQEIASKPSADSSKHHSAMQPIDLSGSTASGSKLKVRQHLIDPSHTARLLKQDDIPEVGSTTASIEEMQDAQKYLWHPLFGNQKNYNSPWNWTTVTATGE